MYFFKQNNNNNNNNNENDIPPWARANNFAPRNRGHYSDPRDDRPRDDHHVDDFSMDRFHDESTYSPNRRSNPYSQNRRSYPDERRYRNTDNNRRYDDDRPPATPTYAERPPATYAGRERMNQSRVPRNQSSSLTWNRGGENSGCSARSARSATQFYVDDIDEQSEDILQHPMKRSKPKNNESFVALPRDVVDETDENQFGGFHLLTQAANLSEDEDEVQATEDQDCTP